MKNADDEDLCLYERGYDNGFELFNTCEVELLKIVNTEMNHLKHSPNADIDYGELLKDY